MSNKPLTDAEMRQWVKETWGGFGPAPIKAEGTAIPLEERIRNLNLGIQQDEALLRQALEALDCPSKARTADEQAAIAALRERLGETK